MNYVLASALKADKIEPHNLGLVLSYLGEVNAPSIYYQYAILRVHQNLHKVRLVDIAITLNEMHHLIDQDKIAKLMRRVENHFEVTSEKLLLENKGGNVKALWSIFCQYAHHQFGQPPFWKKLERLLADEIDKKKYVMSLDELVPLMMYMAVQKTHNDALWGALVQDLDNHIELGSVSNI